MRLAAIYALLDCSEVICEDHLMAALAFWEYTEQSVHHIFGWELGDPIADEIYEALKQRSNGMSRTGIRDLFKRNVSSERIGRALSQLQCSNMAKSISVPTDGRPVEIWSAVAV